MTDHRSSPDIEQDGTFTGVVIKRMGVLIDTADKSSRWEMEARAAMMSATHLLKQPAEPVQCSAGIESAPIDNPLKAYTVEQLQYEIAFRCDAPAQAAPEPLSLQAVREDERLACWKIAEAERASAAVDKAAWLVAFDIANAIKARTYAQSSPHENSEAGK